MLNDIMVMNKDVLMYKNQALDFAESNDHIFPAYHMNKNNWITILLDGSLSDELISELIKKSYLLSNR